MKTFTSYNITLPGIAHLKQFQNCQDHAFTEKYSDLLIGVVSDGVGSLHYSEFTSLLMSSWTIKTIKENIDLLIKVPEQFIKAFNEELAKVKNDVFEYLHPAVKRNCYAAILLFYVVTSEKTYVFVQGDGYYGINNDVYKCEGNSHYIEDCTLELLTTENTADVESIWVSTDGLRYSEKIMKYLMGHGAKNDIEDLIRDEHKKEILRDDFGLALAWR